MFKEFDYDKLPVVDIVNQMIIDAAKKNASDIHFDPTPTILKVRIRVDGELIDYATVPENVKNPLVTRIKIISGMNITESRLPQDGAIKNMIEGTNLDLRVSTLPIVYGEKVVIRILDYSMSTNGLESLGFSPRNFEKVKKLIEIPNGIILITGATGTGKSTTVYSMLQILNTSERNIITVEDPVEMKLAGINQVQTMSEIGLTFASALRSILRQDPDVIMIGEIRDDETARIAVRASITGHLVLSTIHTNNSLNTIERLLDMEVERYLLGSALAGVISQRLVKKLCPKCRTSRPATDYEKTVFQEVLGMNITDIYTPVGCDECYNGYKGRVAIQEVLSINQSIRDAITNNIRKEDLRKLVYDKEETATLLEDGLTKVIEGLTSFEEIIRVIDIEDDLGEEDSKIRDALMGKKSNPTPEENKETDTEASKTNLEDENKIAEEPKTEDNENNISHADNSSNDTQSNTSENTSVSPTSNVENSKTEDINAIPVIDKIVTNEELPNQDSSKSTNKDEENSNEEKQAALQSENENAQIKEEEIQTTDNVATSSSNELKEDAPTTSQDTKENNQVDATSNITDNNNDSSDKSEEAESENTKVVVPPDSNNVTVEPPTKEEEQNDATDTNVAENTLKVDEETKDSNIQEDTNALEKENNDQPKIEDSPAPIIPETENNSPTEEATDIPIINDNNNDDVKDENIVVKEDNKNEEQTLDSQQKIVPPNPELEENNNESPIPQILDAPGQEDDNANSIKIEESEENGNLEDEPNIDEENSIPIIANQISNDDRDPASTKDLEETPEDNSKIEQLAEDDELESLDILDTLDEIEELDDIEVL